MTDDWRKRGEALDARLRQMTSEERHAFIREQIEQMERAAEAQRRRREELERLRRIYGVPLFRW